MVGDTNEGGCMLDNSVIGEQMFISSKKMATKTIKIGVDDGSETTVGKTMQTTNVEGGNC